MYLIPIHVPIYTDGEKKFVTSDWMRSLVLLRDSLNGKFGQLMLMAPSLPASMAPSHTLEELGEAATGIKVKSSFDLRCRARYYWQTERFRWQSELAEAMRDAKVVHAGMDDLYRPIAFEGCLQAVRHNKPLIFVRDIDQVQQMREMASELGLAARLKAELYGFGFDRCMRYGVKKAALSLLKGKLLRDRYWRFASNPSAFEDTSFTTSEIVPFEVVKARIGTLRTLRAIRLVYCGRIEARKGVDHGIKIIAKAASLGMDVFFDVIGEGSDQAKCEALASELGIGARVRFLGYKTYGRELLRDLAEYDGLLFTPLAEDTPRMIFDAYAAGLPVIAYGIEYVKERAGKEGATVILPVNNPEEGGRLLAQLDGNRMRLGELALKAREAATVNAADVWYERRAQWTFEAVERFYARD